MKVKVDGMTEKPTNTDNTETPDESTQGDDCSGGLAIPDDDMLPRKRHSSEKKVSIALEEIEDIDDEVPDADVSVQTVSDADDIFVSMETKPKPPPRTDSHCGETKAGTTSEADDMTESSSKPVPPPRSDSKGRNPKVRHMVDILGGYETEDRFSWDHQREYLLTCMGFVNGLGCLLKGTTLILKHGGGVFFIAYVICMLVFGCPLVYLEITLGQYASGGPLTAWNVIPLFRGIGYTMVATTFMVSTYYMAEITWAIYYFGVAMSTALGGKRLPWDFSNNSVEVLSDTVYLHHNSLPQPDDATDVKLRESTPHSLQFSGAVQYFYSEVLQYTGSVDELGSPVWYLVLCLILAWVCIYTCLIYGPSSIGKVMYLTAPYPYITLPVLFVFMSFEEGSLNGIRFFLSPNWSGLAGVEVWKDAAKLMFYTLSLGTGCLHTLAGYTHFHSHCFRNLVLICLCNVMGVMFGGLTMCSGLGIFANITNISITDIQVTEYELGFALYPYILTKVSESTALSMLFFSIIIINGFDTLMIYVQTIVGSVMENMMHYGIGCTRLARWMVQLVLCVILTVIGLIFTTNGGVLAHHFADSYLCQICPYVVTVLECCLLMYIFGSRKFVQNIEDMTGHKNSPWWICNWKFLSPCILLALITCNILFPIHVTYKDVSYPDWSEILGWCLSVVPILCIPVYGIKAFIQYPGTFIQRLKELLRTPHGWGAGLVNNPDHDNNAPDYVICHPDNHRPMHGLAMLTANLYVPQLTPLSAEEVPQETSSEMTGGYLSDLITITSTDSIESGPENEERGNWRGKLEFILSCLGYVVGLGNIWRFPYLVYRNGGGAFFIPYLVMLTFCGIPLVFMEMGFGQYASLGPVTIWRAVPIFKGVGYAMVVSVALICVYYNMVNAWAFHYLFSSFTANLPWASCDNSWNTEGCRLNKYQVTNCSLLNETFLEEPSVKNSSCGIYLQGCISSSNHTQFLHDNTTGCINWLHGKFGEAVYLPDRKSMMANLTDPSEEYFFNEVLNQSEGLQDLGPVQWQLALYLLLCWVIVFMCLVRGIYSAGKVAYFVVIIPIILLVVLLVCAMMVEGHLEGIRFYVTPKWNKILTMQVWSDAASQVFFSLSACSGGLTTLSSYNKFHNNIYRDAILICVIDTLMSILAGFTVFASLGILAHQLNTTTDKVVTSSTGLIFVAFPAAVTNFQPSSMWSALFFLMIVMMGMSSILVMTEIIITVIMDENMEIFRKSRIMVLSITCFVLYLIGLPMTTRGGPFLLQLFDEFVGGTPNVVIGIFMCVSLAWVYKVRHFCTDLRLMLGRRVNWWWRAMWCFMSPVIMMFILVSTIISGLNLADEHFPIWAEPFGITLTVLCVISIPGYAVKKIHSLEGPIKQRIQEACLSEENWGPALIKHWKHVEYYPAVNTHTLSVDIEQSPVHAISDRVDFTTSQVRLPKLSEATLLTHNKQMSPKRPQELRQKAILNHAYSNPQCNLSNGSIDQIKPRLSLQETSPSTDILIVMKKKSSVRSQDASTQTDARSFTLALKQGSVRSLKELRIEPEVSPSTSGNTVEVEVTKF